MGSGRRVGQAPHSKNRAPEYSGKDSLPLLRRQKLEPRFARSSVQSGRDGSTVPGNGTFPLDGRTAVKKLS